MRDLELARRMLAGVMMEVDPVTVIRLLLVIHLLESLDRVARRAKP